MNRTKYVKDSLAESAFDTRAETFGAYDDEDFWAKSGGKKRKKSQSDDGKDKKRDSERDSGKSGKDSDKSKKDVKKDNKKDEKKKDKKVEQTDSEDDKKGGSWYENIKSKRSAKRGGGDTMKLLKSVLGSMSDIVDSKDKPAAILKTIQSFLGGGYSGGSL